MFENIKQYTRTHAEHAYKSHDDATLHNLRIHIQQYTTAMTHCDFRVRQVVVLRALQWLVTNNQYYRALGVTIDTNALEQLPQDENVANLT